MDRVDLFEELFSQIFTLLVYDYKPRSTRYGTNKDVLFLLRRALNDWEIDRIVGILQTLESFKTTTKSIDKPIWMLNCKGSLILKSAYGNNISNTMLWPWKLIWKIKIPPQIYCFTWLVVRKACLTHERLLRRFQICTRWLLCGIDVETNDHLFIHCRANANLWYMFFCILGVSWVTPYLWVTQWLWKGIGRINGEEKRIGVSWSQPA